MRTTIYLISAEYQLRSNLQCIQQTTHLQKEGYTATIMP